MLFNFFTKSFSIKPTILVILDGFGIAPASQGNAISLAKKPNIDKLFSTFPNTELIASGESVGLPANEVGNTEVGHLTMGAGRTILQDLKRINKAIETGTFFDNRALVAAGNNVKANSSSFHIIGLVSSGNVHSSLTHFFALVQFCKKEGLKDVKLHLITDGRDAPPKEGIEVIEKIENYLKLQKIGQVASVSGRYYAMDRDNRWDRTEKAYKAIVQGLAVQTKSAIDAVNSAYARGQTDEFIEPTVIADQNGPVGMVRDSDSVVFFNYRIDRPRQLSMSFVDPEFEKAGAAPTFQRGRVPKNIFFVTMTEYQKGLPVSGIAFGPEPVDTPLGAVISGLGLKQLHMSESEKERFVTYYFNGLREEPFAGEDRMVIPSPKVETYDKKPEMSLPKLAGEFSRQLRRDIYHFAVVNFANADMVAHSGNLTASVRAIEFIDRYLNELIVNALRQDATVLITADHGNAEELVTFPTTTYFFTTNKGTVNTDHSNNPVPLLIINKNYESKQANLGKGALCDVAPTILGLMGISKPGQMTGRNLLEGSTQK